MRSILIKVLLPIVFCINFTSAHAAPLTVTPSALDFGNQLVGTTSATQTVSVKNTSGFTLSGAIGFTNTDFQYAGGSCGASLANGATCTISIVFTPTAYGPVAGALTFGPYTAATLSGTGTGLPAASLSAASLTFGNQLLNTASATKAVTLSNFSASGATLSIASIAASGDFSQTNNCGASLVAGATCTINVTFTPTLLGLRNGGLSIASDAPGSPHSVALSGMGRTAGMVAAGATHSAALKTDGSVWAWGWNADGDGTGTIAERYAPVQVMAAGSGAVALASGGGHTVVLKANGSVWAWGNNAYGQLGDGTLTSRTAPVQVMASPGVPLSGVVAVAAGQWYTLALKADGTVLAWGNNNAGQLGDNTSTVRSTPVQVLASPGVLLSGVVAVSAGQMHAMALKSDGTVVAWGYNGSGQLGDGTTTTPRYLPVQVMASPGVPLTGVASLAAGLAHSMALKSDGTLWTWGSDMYGQLGEGWGTDKSAPVQVMLSGATPLTGVAAMASGSLAMHSFALKSDGSLWGWGYTDNGEVGNGTYGWSPLASSHVVQAIGNPVQVMAAGSSVVSMAGGQYHSLAIKSDNSVWAWGENTFGRLGDGIVVTGNAYPTATPVAANFNSPAATLSAAALNFSQILNTASPVQTVRLTNPGSAVLNVSSLSLAGVDYVQTNNCPAGGSFIALASGAYCDISFTFTPAATGARNGSLTINTNAMGSPHSVTLTGTGLPPLVGMQPDQMVFRALTVGTSSVAQTLTLTNNSASTVTLSSIVASGNFTQTNTCSAPLAAGAACTVSVTFTPGAVGSRIGGLTITSDAPSSPHSMVLAGTGRSSGIGVGAGMFHSVALKPDGNVEAWGSNTSGQLGDGTTTYRPSPVQVLSGAVRLAVGASHALALKSDGSLWAWGSNSSGQLGDNTTTQRNSPVQIMAAGSGVVDIVAGSSHSLALKSDGSVWAWGWNMYGTLGDNTTTQRNAPVQIMAAGSGVVQLAAGANHTLALKSDGSVWAWGDNYYGELGIGSAGLGANSNPIQLMTSPGVALSGVVALAAGGSHSVALKSDGSVWAWGYNLYGQLGDNTTTQRNSPVQVMAAGSGTVALVAGESQTLALKSDGSVSAWGRNNLGQLGDGTTTQHNAPVQAMAAGSGVVDMAAGSFHGLAFKSDISVLAWGDNSAGQLGDGTSTQHLSPIVSNFNVAIPVYSIYPTINFAGQLLNVTGTSSVTLSNIGTIALNITSIAASGDFAQSNNCGSSLAAGASCSISLSFTPTAAGVRNGALTVNSNAINSPYSVSLSGEGLAPVANLSAASLNFGTQNLGFSSAVQTVTLDNIAGTAQLHIASISANGDFTQTNNCPASPATLYQGSSCTISVTFTPAAGGARSGSLTVTSDAPGSPHTVALSGTGNPVPIANFSATNIVYGTRNVGTASAARSITLTNNGSATLNMASVGLSGANAGDFNLTNGCGATLAVGASCTLSATMTPSAAGLRTATITVASNAVGNPHNLALAGMGRQGSVAAGRYHSLVLKPNGSVWAWGVNMFGQLGDGTGLNKILPVQAMAPGSGVIELAAGLYHTLALKSDGSVWAWGINSSGELGDGTTTQRNSPVQVSGLSGVVGIVAGNSHSLALKSDGSVWAWGNNNVGQLGDGTTTYHPSPVQVTGLSGVVALAAGSTHSLALKADGSVWAWGDNGYGGLGDGTGVGKVTPVQVIVSPGIPLTGVVQLVAGLYDSLALKSDGSVWGWGNNTNGQFGIAMSTFNNNPVQSIAAGSGVVLLAVGSAGNHTLLLKSDGSVWATGHNFYGQIGIGTSGLNTDQFAPVQVIAAGSGAVALAGNEQHSLVLKSDGSLAAWGSNGAGQLGDGSTTQRLTPAAANFNWAWASLSAASFNFTQPLGGGASSTQSVTLTNTGLVSLNISGITVSGSFAQSGNTCGASLAPGASCSVGVAFTPNAVGTHSGSLTFNSDSASGGQQIVALSGNGTAALATLTSTALNFGSQTVNTVGSAQWVMLSNTGNVTMNIAGITASGDFMQVNTCGATLAPAANCYIFPLFIPTAVGARSGAVTITSDAYQHPHTITLSGTGVAVPAVSLNPTALTFAARNIGNPSVAQVVTLTNSGNGVLNISSIAASGDYARTTTCGSTLAAGANCAISVTFTATAMGARTGAVTITSDAASSPNTISLSGTGKASTRSDFDGDGKADIFWRDNTTGQNALWFMNGAAASSYAFTSTAAANWSAVGISDFNGDGNADILWRDQTTGSNALWFMNGQNVSSVSLTGTASPSWSVAGTGDFDGDGKQNDILWFNAASRQTAVWITNNGQMSSYGYVYGAVPAGWSIAGVGDFDGDGKSDILWRNTANGTNVIWFMNGVNLLGTTAIASAPPVWSIKGVADFDADGKADIFWQDTAGNTYVWLMNGAATKGLATSIFVGTAWTALQFADFNGDGKADILWRNAAGQTYVWLMNGLVLPTYAPSMSATLSWTAIGK